MPVEAGRRGTLRDDTGRVGRRRRGRRRQKLQHLAGWRGPRGWRTPPRPSAHCGGLEQSGGVERPVAAVGRRSTRSRRRSGGRRLRRRRLAHNAVGAQLADDRVRGRSGPAGCSGSTPSVRRSQVHRDVTGAGAVTVMFSDAVAPTGTPPPRPAMSMLHGAGPWPTCRTLSTVKAIRLSARRAGLTARRRCRPARSR